jgi:hypothetical protein
MNQAVQVLDGCTYMNTKEALKIIYTDPIKKC